ncbi:MAG: LacI family DNA-binding transcriptional regulator [Oscillospiraceae bacterium]
MTLKEIAAQANVSISTVSRVLNASSPGAASKEVQNRIWEIAHAGGYMPNKEAQALKKSGTSFPESTRSIFCLVACSSEEVREDPFFTQAISSIEREAFHQGYMLKYTFYSGDSESGSTMQLMQEASSNQLIIIGRFQLKLYQALCKHFKTIVYLGWNDLDIHCDGVICDGYLAAQEAVSYLYQLGHRRIGFVGADRQEARFRGYIHALEKLGLERSERNIATNPVLSYESGCRGLERLLAQDMDATALYCANDTTAIGVLRACKSHGLRVPEDLSVMGANDIETDQYVSPMLTTIHIPLDEMGKVATRVLIDRINGGHTLPLKVLLPFHIVRRESCAAPPVKVIPVQ